ncbi:hypothetical protein ACLI4Q_01465 [Natrialbaceae archaeon A-CW1-1]
MLEFLSQFTDIIFPAVYILFFIGTLGVLALAHWGVVRQVWLAGFFATLIAVTLVGMPLLPVVEMHKFAQPSDEEETYYEIRVVDAAGNEIELDDRATPPMTGTRTSTVAGEMANDYTDEERLELGAFYLETIQEYRGMIEAGGPPAYERLQPPRYVDDHQWTADELEDYEEFEAIHIYERTVIYTDDNTAVASNEERHRVTIDVANETVTEPEQT